MKEQLLANWDQHLTSPCSPRCSLAHLPRTRSQWSASVPYSIFLASSFFLDRLSVEGERAQKMEHRKILVMVYSSSSKHSDLVNNAVARSRLLVGREIWLVRNYCKKLI